MLCLLDVAYSRDETISAIRDYYHFLTNMYLDEDKIIEPPAKGWTHITSRSFTLDKSKEFVNLLRHLPYIKTTHMDTIDAERAPDCRFADWQDIFERGADRAAIRLGTEDASFSDKVSKHIIGLTCGGMYNLRFLLDVELGAIQWYECPSAISNEPSREPIQDDLYGYLSDEEEAEWRAEGEHWSILDFFEELKERFRRLDFVPLSSRRAVHIWKTSPPDYKAMLAGVKNNLPPAQLA